MTSQRRLWSKEFHYMPVDETEGQSITVYAEPEPSPRGGVQS